MQGAQLDELVRETGTSKSQIVEEALALFSKAFMETKRGRRVAIIEPESQKAIIEVVSPTLAQLEWTAYHERVVLSKKGLEKVADMVSKPPCAETLRRLWLKGGGE